MMEQYTEFAKAGEGDEGAQNAFYAMGRGNAPGTSYDTLINMETVNVFNSFTIHVLPSDFMNIMNTHKQGVTNATYHDKDVFESHIRALLSYGEGDFGMTLPTTGGITISSTTTSEDFKAAVAEAKRVTLDPTKREKFINYLTLVANTRY
jgi:hypothetical protein